MNLHKLKGVIVPMVTPIDAYEKVDLESTRNLAEHLISGGVQGLFLLGSTGEFCALSNTEKEKFLGEVVNVVANRAVVIVGVSEPGTRRTQEMIGFAADKGADGAVVTPPYYFPLSQKGVIEHYEYLAQHSKLPIILYNVPLTTGVFIHEETIAYLAKRKAIAMVKDSSGDFLYFQDLLTLIKSEQSECRVFQGHEGLSCASLFMGADGLVPAYANIAPKLYVSLYEGVQSGHVEKALRLQRLVTDLIKTYQYGSVYSALKAGLESLGLCQKYVTKPLQYPTAEERTRIERCLDTLGEGGFL